MEAELLAAIAAAPSDAGPREVYADWLLREGDERGELLALELADRRGELFDEEVIYRLMELVARYGFPAQPGDLVDERLPFVKDPVIEHHAVEHDGHRYDVEYRDWWLTVTIDGGEIDSGLDGFDGHNALELTQPYAWSELEREVILSVLGRAIRRGRPLSEVQIPITEAIDRYATLGSPVVPEDPLFGVVDHERWYMLWKRWMRRP